MSTQEIEAKDPSRLARAVTTSAAPSRSSRRTRTSRAWGAITFGLAVLIVVLVFALQNLESVEVTFLSLHGDLPLAVLLLVVAALGALIVFTFGAARIVQLRVGARRSRRDLRSRSGSSPAAAARGDGRESR